jgi:hypothetical protein
MSCEFNTTASIQKEKPRFFHISMIFAMVIIGNENKTHKEILVLLMWSWCCNQTVAQLFFATKISSLSQ